MEDRKIIDLIRSQKHDKVFAALYKYLPVVRKLILANGGKPEDAEDIYQEALIVFYEKAKEPDFNLSSSINTYIYSICRFMWRDHLKKKQRSELFVELKDQPVSETEFASEIERQEQLKLAEKVISELGDRCKELLMLFYFHSKKFKDIATEMKYNSENTAKNQKYKCLETAKIRLQALKQN